MAIVQKYGIKYPFTLNNDDNYFLDLNETYEEGIKSKLLHILMTTRGQKLRDPKFGTRLIDYIFSQGEESIADIKTEIQRELLKYIPNIEFDDINVYDEEDEHGKIIVVHYNIKKGNSIKEETVALKI